MARSQPYGGGMSSGVSCMNNAGMANNMSKAGLPAPPIPWNDRCCMAVWNGFAGMRLAGSAAGRGAGSMGGVLHTGSIRQKEWKNSG